MQNINNNMDELFKQAAAGYPLKTDHGDWDAVASRLFNTPVASLPVKKKSKFNKYGPALLLVVLGLILIAIPYKPENNHLQNAHRLPDVDQNQLPLSNKSTIILHNKDHTQIHSKRSRKKLSDQAISPIGNTTIEHISSTTFTIDAPDLTYNTEKTTIANKINTPVIDTVKKPVVVDEVQRKPHIYWGIVLGPAINRVKNQKLQKPGFDIGIMAGISLFKGNAYVETGLLYAQKYYYSTGRYFNMEKGAMPPGMEIMSLEGSSSLFELPVRFKYKVLEKQRSASFLSAGVSSYLMTREENNYDAMMNGTPESMTGSYNNKSRYIAVMANMGAEYNYFIGKHTFLRIEPYLQIPLKGIGVGSMPIMTTGVHIGLMRFTP